MANPILSEDTIHALADAQPDTVFLVDKTGIIRYVKPRCNDSLGFAQSDLIGQTMLELVVQRDRDRTIKEAGEVLAGHKRTGFENRYRHRDGSDIHFSWSARWLHHIKCDSAPRAMSRSFGSQRAHISCRQTFWGCSIPTSGRCFCCC
jgi:PAS domain S-box-containing protein